MSASGALDAHDSATRPTPTLMTMAWSVRRELWENRWVWAAPFAAGVIFLFAYLVSLLTLPERMSAALSAPPEQRHELIVQPYVLAAVLMIGTGVVVGVFYSLDALYSERRDRSVLFWRSLPVADVTAVLAKATIPIVILPLLTVAFAHAGIEQRDGIAERIRRRTALARSRTVEAGAHSDVPCEHDPRVLVRARFRVAATSLRLGSACAFPLGRTPHPRHCRSRAARVRVVDLRRRAEVARHRQR